MCGQGRFWEGALPGIVCLDHTLMTAWLFHSLFQVRVVQHKNTREMYALKYINKHKCVKMKAVANIIQERRLLEEVRSHLFCPS
jgi:hypothetical protein